MKPVQNIKPVQYAQVSYIVHFSRINFEINGYFYLFLFLFLEVVGTVVEVILEDFISEIV